MTWTIDPLRVPAALDDADAQDFREFWRIGNEAWRRDTGTDVNDDDAADVLERWREETYRTHAGLVAREGGRVIAAGSLEIEKTVARTAEIDVSVAAGHERTGVADALLAAVEGLAREHGRSVLQTWTGHRPDAGAERLVPPTGAGAIPAHDPPTERMVRAGYALRQVERNSVFDLHGSYDAVDRLLESAVAKAGPDYRVVWWSGPVPDRYADGYARAVSRMSTDVPAGDMVTEQRHWDAARLRERDARLARAGSLMGVTLVVHEPTGEVAAFNDLQIGSDHTRPTAQYGTLVMPEHRGRRLGAIVKCVGLRNWHEAVPESPCVSTFNAEENRYMLDVNEAVGFRPVSYAAAWEKTLG
ncbi:GNAT family N-acetyltransferase [Microbacterium betulae]|uniref:GNAT family N-acetyltransferase n=1 Tax=Microbacterium betulae TaxID=2981139 RepID=A0AA97I524_9MICO|nr:GNAT family N-acetyltransferase [Microbacterium sp. AB]WOF21612.1 GNAT family N-acetyltransferase [Microbacterium sp. AB]